MKVYTVVHRKGIIAKIARWLHRRTQWGRLVRYGYEHIGEPEGSRNIGIALGNGKVRLDTPVDLPTTDKR